ILDAEAEPSHLVFAQADNLYDVAQRQDVFHPFDSLLGNFGNMNHTFLAGSELYKSAELFDIDHFSGKDLAGFKIRDNGLDILNRLVHTRFFHAADGNSAVLDNLDLNTRLFDDGVDSLASLTDHIADFRRIDHDLNDLGRIGSHAFSRLRDNRFHNLRQNILPCFFRSGNGLLDNGTGQPVNLDIHLDSGDTVVGTCHLKVHIAEQIFQTLDIRQHDIILVGFSRHQAGGNPRHRLFDRYAGCHQ